MEEKGFLTNSIINIANFLENEKMKYCICGGIAYSALVEPRATIDMDILLYLDEKKLELLKKKILKKYKNAILNENIMDFKIFKILRILFVFGEKYFILDLLLTKREYFLEVFKRKIELDFEGKILPFLSPEDLYIIKTLSNREIDKIDLKKIKIKYGKNLDFEYIKKWLKKLKE